MMMSLAQNQIHLWLTFTDDIQDPALLDNYRALMNDEERERALRFKGESDRKTHIVTRALVRSVLSRYAPVQPEGWQFTTNPYGRPEIENEEARDAGLDFNVAHSRGLIVMGVSAHRAIGVDVENTTRTTSLEIADRYFAPDEVAALSQVPPEQQHERFFEYWTLKESYIKARGMGLSIPLDKFSFNFPRERSVEINIDPVLADDGGRWQFWQFRPAPDYMVTVCAVRPSVGPTQLSVQRIVPNRTEAALPTEMLRS